MVRKIFLGIGTALILIAFVLYITHQLPTGQFAFQVNALCETDLIQLGQLYNAETSQLCVNVSLVIFGIYASAILGIILVIVGVVIPKSFKDKTSNENHNALDILEERYAKGEITKEEFDKMKEDLN